MVILFHFTRTHAVFLKYVTVNEKTYFDPVHNWPSEGQFLIFSGLLALIFEVAQSMLKKCLLPLQEDLPDGQFYTGCSHHLTVKYVFSSTVTYFLNLRRISHRLSTPLEYSFKRSIYI
jgi:hypothetical protein